MSLLDEIRLRKPVDCDLVTQGFGENPSVYARFGLPGHNGVDFGCLEGSDVMAAEGGKVIRTGWDASGYGNYVLVEHGGYQTLYGHLSKVVVSVNQVVQKGEVIGYSGNTGFSTGPHLHFELRVPGYGAEGYRKGEVDALRFFEAVDMSVTPGGDENEIEAGGWVELDPLFAYVNIRPEPRAGADVADLGDLHAGIRLKVIEVMGEWVGVEVWINRNYLMRAD